MTEVVAEKPPVLPEFLQLYRLGEWEVLPMKIFSPSGLRYRSKAHYEDGLPGVRAYVVGTLEQKLCTYSWVRLGLAAGMEACKLPRPILGMFAIAPFARRPLYAFLLPERS